MFFCDFCVYDIYVATFMCFFYDFVCSVSLRWYLRFKFIIGNVDIPIREVDEINPEVCFTAKIDQSE